MLTRDAKQMFYNVAGLLMTVNGWIYRTFRAAGAVKKTPVRLHLGPGPKAYLPGWTNIDANMFTAKCDIWLDLRNPLPFPEGTVDAVYSHHVIEHLPDPGNHLRDVFRVLKPGGVYRVGGPNGDVAISKFMENDHDWFNDWPDKYDSIGGRFANFIFCRNEHLTILTQSFVTELATRAGFAKVRKHPPITGTDHFALFADCLAKEHERTPEAPHTLLLEMQKPAREPQKRPET